MKKMNLLLIFMMSLLQTNITDAQDLFVLKNADGIKVLCIDTSPFTPFTGYLMTDLAKKRLKLSQPSEDDLIIMNQYDAKTPEDQTKMVIARDHQTRQWVFITAGTDIVSAWKAKGRIYIRHENSRAKWNANVPWK